MSWITKDHLGLPFCILLSCAFALSPADCCFMCLCYAVHLLCVQLCLSSFYIIPTLTVIHSWKMYVFPLSPADCCFMCLCYAVHLLCVQLCLSSFYIIPTLTVIHSWKMYVLPSQYRVLDIIGCRCLWKYGSWARVYDGRGICRLCWICHTKIGPCMRKLNLGSTFFPRKVDRTVRI